MGPGARSALVGAAAVGAALALAASAPAALPRAGLLVPGERLGGISIGMTKAQVRSIWGTRFGRCRDCSRDTWYFTYRPFEPQGAGVAFRRGRVERVFTLWQPAGWRARGGLELGDPESEATRLFGTLVRRHCIRYSALLLPGRRMQTALYVYDGEIWGFGIMRPASSPCV